MDVEGAGYEDVFMYAFWLGPSGLRCRDALSPAGMFSAGSRHICRTAVGVLGLLGLLSAFWACAPLSSVWPAFFAEPLVAE